MATRAPTATQAPRLPPRSGCLLIRPSDFLRAGAARPGGPARALHISSGGLGGRQREVTLAAERSCSPVPEGLEGPGERQDQDSPEDCSYRRQNPGQVPPGEGLALSKSCSVLGNVCAVRAVVLRRRALLLLRAVQWASRTLALASRSTGVRVTGSR